MVLALVLCWLIDSSDAQRPFYAVGFGSNAGSRLGRGVAFKDAPFLPPERLALGPIVQPGVLLNIKEILVSEYHGMAILTSEEMLVWGNNQEQQLGINSTAQFGQTTIVNPMFMRPSIPAPKAQLASMGNNSMVLVRPSAMPSALRGWGENVRGPVYDFATNPALMPFPNNLTFPIINDPLLLGNPSGTVSLAGVADLKCSTRHCVVRMEDGRIIGWGLNGNGEVLPCAPIDSTWCDFTPQVNALLGTNRRIIQTSLANMNTILLTNNSDLIAHGLNVEFAPPGPPPNKVQLKLYDNEDLPVECRLSMGGHVDQIVAGHDFHLLRCGSAVFGFGSNNYYQLGNDTLQVANITQMQRVLLEGANSNETQIIDIAAGKQSGYAVGNNGTLIGWGCTDFKALGFDFGQSRTLPTIINLKPVTDVNCTITGLSAHLSSHGAFVVIGEKLGIGKCPPRPPGMEFGYCNAKGFWTFQTAAVTNGSMIMPGGMVMVGNMTMNGTAIIRIPYGMMVQGRVDLGGKAVAQVSDKAEIVGDLFVDEESTVEINNGTMSVVNGSLSLGSNASLSVSNFTFVNGTDFVDSSEALEAVIEVDGDVFINGSVIVIVSSQITEDLIASGGNGTNPNVTLVSRIVASSSSLTTSSGRNISGLVTVVLETESSSSSCQTVYSEPSLTDTTLTVLLSLDSSSCDSPSSTDPSSPDSPANPASPTAKSRRTTYIIVGAVVGGVVVAAIITLIIIFAVPGAKQAVLPYSGTRV
jgi:alpha-tubulin suppressor-like RCC1 family protein